MTSGGTHQGLLLGVLVVVLFGVLWLQFGPETPAEVPVPASNRTERTAAAAKKVSPDSAGAAKLKLELLQRQPGPLAAAARNPFQFRSIAPAPRPETARVTTPVEVAPPPSGPPPPPPVPPITLRFFGLTVVQGTRVATFSDGRGGVFHGKEGDIIEGRYRVLRIGADSVELAYLDGRGRQAIRLSGQ